MAVVQERVPVGEHLLDLILPAAVGHLDPVEVVRELSRVRERGGIEPHGLEVAAGPGRARVIDL
jgi:hypothetical protein